jgi:hypothetical protein
MVTWVVDLVALAVTLLMLAALIVPGGGVLPGRPAIALVVVMFVPGWAVLRLVGAPLHAISVLGSVALSISLAMLTSLAAVGWFGWHWRALALLWTLASAGALVAVIARPPLPRELDDDLDDDLDGDLDDHLHEDLVELAWDDRTWAIAQPQWHTGSTASTTPVDHGADVFDERLLWLITLAGVTVAGVAIAFADSGDIDGYGLISAVSLWFYLGIALLLAALFAHLHVGGRAGHIGAAVNLACLIVVLHGLPGFVEPQPRFPVAWLHAGFANQIAYGGELLPRLDARFSWAGFFSGAAFLERLADTPDLVWVLRFTPVVVNGAAALAVFALARAVGTNVSRSIVAATIFVSINWIGQDYFAPQAVGFVLVTTIVATVLMYFSEKPSADRRVIRLLGSSVESPPAITGRSATFVYLACVFVAAGIIASHQLSPPMLVAMLLALAFVGRTRTKLLGPIVALGFVLWMSHAAESYWVGHLDDVFGEVGDVGGLLNSNVSRRTGPGSPARELVVRSRIALMLVTWAIAGLAMLGQRRRRALDPALAALFFSPFVVLAMQSYGGEALLRVALFTLPAASILMARMELPLRVADRLRVPRFAVPALALACVVPLFLLARFGNESYEQVIPDDRAVVADMYRLVPDDSRVYVVNRSTVMYSERLKEVLFRDLSSDPLTAWQMLEAADKDEVHVYVLVTDGQAGYRHEVQGADPGWLAEFKDRLLGTGSFRIVSQHGQSMLLEHIRGT